jgi:hypothetical protein
LWNSILTGIAAVAAVGGMVLAIAGAVLLFPAGAAIVGVAAVTATQGGAMIAEEHLQALSEQLLDMM